MPLLVEAGLDPVAAPRGVGVLLVEAEAGIGLRGEVDAPPVRQHRHRQPRGGAPEEVAGVDLDRERGVLGLGHLRPDLDSRRYERLHQRSGAAHLARLPGARHREAVASRLPQRIGLEVDVEETLSVDRPLERGAHDLLAVGTGDGEVQRQLARGNPALAVAQDAGQVDLVAGAVDPALGVEEAIQLQIRRSPRGVHPVEDPAAAPRRQEGRVEAVPRRHHVDVAVGMVVGEQEARQAVLVAQRAAEDLVVRRARLDDDSRHRRGVPEGGGPDQESVALPLDVQGDVRDPDQRPVTGPVLVGRPGLDPVDADRAREERVEVDQRRVHLVRRQLQRDLLLPEVARGVALVAPVQVGDEVVLVDARGGELDPGEVGHAHRQLEVPLGGEDPAVEGEEEGRLPRGDLEGELPPLPQRLAVPREDRRADPHPVAAPALEGALGDDAAPADVALDPLHRRVELQRRQLLLVGESLGEADHHGAAILPARGPGVGGEDAEAIGELEVPESGPLEPPLGLVPGEPRPQRHLQAGLVAPSHQGREALAGAGPVGGDLQRGLPGFRHGTRPGDPVDLEVL